MFTFLLAQGHGIVSVNFYTLFYSHWQYYNWRHITGQKFAMMEEKVILANIFRNFHLKAKDKRDEIVLLNEVVLRPRDGIRVHLTPRLLESL